VSWDIGESGALTFFLARCRIFTERGLFMSIQSFSVIDSTLREGEQFAKAHYTIEEKIRIARALDAFGVEYIELTSPAASPQSFEDCKTIAGLGLNCKILTHTRCHMDDARKAVATGVDGVDILFGTSSYLRRFSHGKTIDEIIASARVVIDFIKQSGCEVRFSSEDTFRSEEEDLLRVYQAVDELGVNRIGLADTVGVATPRQLYILVSELKKRVKADIEFHGHNDSGCAIANSFTALEAGATHIDTSVLGIGERNGITPLGGLIARLYSYDRDLVTKYRLDQLHHLDRMVAGIVGIQIPFNNYITGETSFTHKAGMHTKAVMLNPGAYEPIDPQDFGMERTISIGHRLTGKNAIQNRAQELGLHFGDTQLREITQEIKRLADAGPLSTRQLDDLLRSWVVA